ncbi:hypothetical protein ACFL4A_03020, partial [bacterium]
MLFQKVIKTMILILFVSNIAKDASYGIIVSNPVIQVNKGYTSEKIARITEKFTSADKRKIYIIPDLHCNKEVQRMIEKIIEKIMRKHEKKNVCIGVEGASGRFDVRRIKDFIPHKEEREKIVEKLVDEGYIGGAELYA